MKTNNQAAPTAPVSPAAPESLLELQITLTEAIATQQDTSLHDRVLETTASLDFIIASVDALGADMNTDGLIFLLQRVNEYLARNSA